MMLIIRGLSSIKKRHKISRSIQLQTPSQKGFFLRFHSRGLKMRSQTKRKKILRRNIRITLANLKRSHNKSSTS